MHFNQMYNQEKIYLLLGGDLGDVSSTFKKSIQMIDDLAGNVLESSSIFASKSWGFETDTVFYNQALRIESSLEPLNLLKTIMEIEEKLGRVRTGEGYQSRFIDIDLLFMDTLVMNTTDLILPHPRLHLRNFVLWPLSQIAGEFVHPVLGKSINYLMLNTSDQSLIRVID